MKEKLPVTHEMKDIFHLINTESNWLSHLCVLTSVMMHSTELLIRYPQLVVCSCLNVILNRSRSMTVESN